MNKSSGASLNLADQVSALSKDSIVRPSLDNALDELLTRKLLTVNAPHGSGSTTAIASWCHRMIASSNIRIAWINAGHLSNDGDALVHAANEKISHSLEKDLAIENDGISNPSSIEELFAFWGRTIPAGLHLVVVFDDYSPSLPDDIHRGLDRAIALLPPHIHIACLSTNELPLSMTLLRAMNQAVSLGYDALRFNDSDTARLVNLLCDRACSQETAHAISTATDGWAMGIKLVCLDDSNIQSSHLPKNAASCYSLDTVKQFVEETVDQLNDEMAEQAIVAGALGYIPYAMAEEVLGWEDAPILMRNIERSTSCFSLLRDEVLACQPVLRHSFDAMLLKRGKGERDLLHKKACDWLMRNDEPAHALSHALILEDWALAAQLIGEEAERKIKMGDLDVFSALDSVSSVECTQNNSELMVFCAASFIAAGNSKEADGIIGSISDKCGLPLKTDNLVISEKPDALELACSALLVRSLVLTGDYKQALEFGFQIRKHLPELSSYVRCWLSVGMAQAASHCMRPDDAIELVQEDLEYARRESLLSVELMLGYHLGNLYLERLKITRAVEVYSTCIASIERVEARRTALTVLPKLGLAKACLWRGDPKVAEEFLRSESQLLTNMGDPFFLTESQMLESEVLRLKRSYEESMAVLRKAIQHKSDGRGMAILAQQAMAQLFVDDGKDARRWLENSADFTDPKDDFPRMATIQLGRCRALVRNDPSAAAENAKSLIHASRLMGRDAVLVQALLVQAVALSRIKEPGAANRSLVEAIRIAAPERAILPFIGGEGVHASILAQLLEDGNVQGAMLSSDERDLAQKALDLAPFSDDAHQDEPITQTVRLTAREFDVLRLLADGCTMAKAAEEMGVSESTINTHRANLYSKLGIHTRKQLMAIYKQIQTR